MQLEGTREASGFGRGWTSLLCLDQEDSFGQVPLTFLTFTFLIWRTEVIDPSLPHG